MSADGYLPPGCRYSDLPGWHDTEVTVTGWCETCGDIKIDDVTVDSRGSDWEAECPDCNATVSGTYDPVDDYDPPEPEEPANWEPSGYR